MREISKNMVSRPLESRAIKYQTEEVAFKALKGYLKRKDKDIQKLCDYARRLKKPLDEIVTALLS